MMYLILIILHQVSMAVLEPELTVYNQEICKALEVFCPIDHHDQQISVAGLIKVNTWKLSEAVLYGISSTYIDENQIPISQSLNASIPYFAYYILSDSVPRSSVGSVGSESTICP
jgi:hypothetical protein